MSIASELTNLSTNITNAYDAINTKGGTIPANKNTANLATAINSISGGGSASVVNGMIENFKASTSTINANTFVEFVNDITVGTDTQLSTISDTYYAGSVVALDNNTVFAIQGTSSNVAYAVIYTINGTTITAGEPTLLNITPGRYISAVALSSDKVFVAYGNTASSNLLYAVIYTINGTTITAGEPTQLSTQTSSGDHCYAVLLETDKVFINHRGGSALYGVVCTISGTTITVGTNTGLASSGTYEYAKAVMLDYDKVFIAHKSGTYLSGVVCTISGTTITVGTDTRLKNTTESSMYIGAALVDTNKVFVHFGYNQYYAVVCVISGMTITTGKAVSARNFSSTVTVQKVGTNKVFITGGLTLLVADVCLVTDTRISTTASDTVLANTSYAGSGTIATLLGANKVFISHRGGLYVSGIVCTDIDASVAPSTDNIQGLTKTACTTSTAGEVWVLST